MLLVAYGDVEFIRRHDAELGIAVLPPELVADDGDVERVGWLLGPVREKAVERGHNEHNRHAGPDSFRHIDLRIDFTRCDFAQFGVAGTNRAASLAAARRFIALSNWVIA